MCTQYMPGYRSIFTEHVRQINTCHIKEKCIECKRAKDTATRTEIDTSINKEAKKHSSRPPADSFFSK